MSATFDALGVSPDLTRALADAGIVQPFPVQALTIPDALAGRDVCGKACTGSGKTLAFGLPLLERVGKAKPGKPTGLVLAPTRELARQVHDVLVPLAAVRGMRVAAVYGGTSMDKQIRRLRKGVDVVIATPGRLIDLADRGDVNLTAVQVVVVDEADRMNDMGFRPQVSWILTRCTTPHQTLLFSATLDGQVASLVERFLRDPVRHEVDEEVTVDAMEHRFLGVHELDKPKLTAAIADANERTLVFVRTKRGAERLLRRLRNEGVKVEAIHGDRSQAQRERGLRALAEGKVKALVATDVAARGLHVEGIDVVIHYDPAEDHKAYLHRSGRTARAGQRGLAVTLVLWNQHTDTRRLQRLLGVEQPVVEMLSNDRRLTRLADWDPADEENVA